MRFVRRNDMHAESDCGRYMIARYGAVYQATRLGTPWRDRRGFDGSVSLHVARFADEAGRAAAYLSCVAACERDAEAVPA